MASSHELDLETLEHVVVVARELVIASPQARGEVVERLWASRPAEALEVVRGWMRALARSPKLRELLLQQLPTWTMPPLSDEARRMKQRAEAAETALEQAWRRVADLEAQVISLNTALQEVQSSGDSASPAPASREP